MPHPDRQPDPPYEPLPVVSSDVVELFEFRPPAFDEIRQRMQQRNPRLARYLLARAQELVPGEQDIHAKERVARLAIEIYALLESQGEVNVLNTELADIAPLPPA